MSLYKLTQIYHCNVGNQYLFRIYWTEEAIFYLIIYWYWIFFLYLISCPVKRKKNLPSNQIIFDVRLMHATILIGYFKMAQLQYVPDNSLCADTNNIKEKRFCSVKHMKISRNNECNQQLLSICYINILILCSVLKIALCHFSIGCFEYRSTISFSPIVDGMMNRMVIRREKKWKK